MQCKHEMKYRATDNLCRCKLCNKLYTNVIKTLPIQKISQVEQQYMFNQMVAE